MNSKPKKGHKAPFVAISVLLLLALSGTVLWRSGVLAGIGMPSAGGNGASAPQNSGPEVVTVPSDEMRAVWIQASDWELYDLTTEEGMRTAAGQMFENAKNTGLTTVIVSVHAYGDAMYQSDYFPWSHLLTGTQGQDPGYDPLAVMVEEAHNRDLRFEAWVNPFRIQRGSLPETLADNNPAVVHPAWAREINGSLWLDPGLPEVRQLLIDGLAEIADKYQVDGIHIYDSLYPDNTGEEFDAESYTAYGNGALREDWRRTNIDTFMQGAYSAIKGARGSVDFGIATQGNITNSYVMQYCDVQTWLQGSGFVDYIIPQLYWGFGYVTAGGQENFAFPNLAAEWAEYASESDVRLYGGLPAYRVGLGDGGTNDQSEWSSGHILVDMVQQLRKTEGFLGFAAYSYDSLYNSLNPGYADMLTLTELLGGQAPSDATQTNPPPMSADPGVESSSAAASNAPEEGGTTPEGAPPPEETPAA